MELFADDLRAFLRNDSKKVCGYDRRFSICQRFCINYEETELFFLGSSVIIFNHFNELARKIKVKRHLKNLNVSHKKPRQK